MRRQRGARRSAYATALLAMALLATALPGSVAATRAAERTLFEALGGAKVLHAAVDRFADLVVADDRINFTFAETDMATFRRLIYEQLCALSGGPCRYTGRDMRTAHAGLGIDTAEFNALAEDLYSALDRAGVPYHDQNRLLALLAPMKRDIVGR